MRRGHADPVRELIDVHRRLCASAVDPLEIAAGLEAQGLTDRTAAAFRHRDVFSLAEELFARVPRDPAADGSGHAERRADGQIADLSGRPAGGQSADRTGARPQDGSRAEPGGGCGGQPQTGVPGQGARAAGAGAGSEPAGDSAAEAGAVSRAAGAGAGSAPAEGAAAGPSGGRAVPGRPPRPGGRAAAAPSACRRGLRPLRAAAHLLPALLCAGGLLAGRLLGRDPVQAAVLQAAAVALTAIAAAAAVRCGPLRFAGGRGGPATGWLWTCWLLAFALFGSQAAGALLCPRSLAGLPAQGAGRAAGGPLPLQPGGSAALPDPSTAAALLGLAVALPAAAWWARRFSRRVRARLASSRRPAEFSAAVRTSLAGTLAGFTAVLAVLLAGAFAVLAPGARPDGTVLGGAAALGLLLFTARLLALHGARGAAAAGPAAACAAQAAGLALAWAAGRAGRRGAGPVLHAVLAAAGPGTLQAAACAGAACALAVCAFAVLGRAGVHCFAESAADLAEPPDQENR